jgi:hypothetical protein
VDEYGSACSQEYNEVVVVVNGSSCSSLSDSHAAAAGLPFRLDPPPTLASRPGRELHGVESPIWVQLGKISDALAVLRCTGRWPRCSQTDTSRPSPAKLASQYGRRQMSGGTGRAEAAVR